MGSHDILHHRTSSLEPMSSKPFHKLHCYKSDSPKVALAFRVELYYHSFQQRFSASSRDGTCSSPLLSCDRLASSASRPQVTHAQVCYTQRSARPQGQPGGTRGLKRLSSGSESNSKTLGDEHCSHFLVYVGSRATLLQVPQLADISLSLLYGSSAGRLNATLSILALTAEPAICKADKTTSEVLCPKSLL